MTQNTHVKEGLTSKEEDMEEKATGPASKERKVKNTINEVGGDVVEAFIKRQMWTMVASISRLLVLPACAIGSKLDHCKSLRQLRPSIALLYLIARPHRTARSATVRASVSRLGSPCAIDSSLDHCKLLQLMLPSTAQHLTV